MSEPVNSDTKSKSIITDFVWSSGYCPNGILMIMISFSNNSMDRESDPRESTVSFFSFFLIVTSEFSCLQLILKKVVILYHGSPKTSLSATAGGSYAGGFVAVKSNNLRLFVTYRLYFPFQFGKTVARYVCSYVSTVGSNLYRLTFLWLLSKKQAKFSKLRS